MKFHHGGCFCHFRTAKKNLSETASLHKNVPSHTNKRSHSRKKRVSYPMERKQSAVDEQEQLLPGSTVRLRLRRISNCSPLYRKLLIRTHFKRRSHLVCPISGVQWNNESEVVRSWKLTSKCVPTITGDKRDPNMYSRAADGSVASGTLNIKNEECKREVRKYLGLFVTSHARKTQELEKYKQNYASGLKLANKFIKHSKKQGIINICTLQNIILTETFSKPIFLRVMRFYANKLDSLAEEISPIILNVWNLVIVPKQILFVIFVPSMLFLLQRGIAVDSVVLVEKNFLLDRILPDANLLNDFGVPKSNFTQTKNTIRAALRALLKKHSLAEIRQMINS